MTTSKARNINEAPGQARFPKVVLYGLPAFVGIASLLVAGAIAYAVYGLAGLGICALVWTVVVVSAAAAYFIGSVFATADMFQSQLLIGIGIRTGIPMAFALFVVQFAKTWLDYGCVYYLFAFYFLGLAVDVFLMVATFRSEPLKAAEKSVIHSSTADISH